MLPLINVKMPTIVWHFIILSMINFMKKFYNLVFWFCSFKVINLFNRGGPIAPRGVLIPVSQRKPIATRDFSRGSLDLKPDAVMDPRMLMTTLKR